MYFKACLTILLFFAADGISMSDEKRLIKYLLENYERVGIVGRPVYNTSETVSVRYGIALIQILDLDEKNQVLTTNVWSRYSWTDMLLTWDPEQYNGVDNVRIPANKIWTPDIVLYNYADIRLTERRDAMAVVMSTGTVMWIPMSIFKSTCSIDITHFPFDVQTCNMKFGSWTYHGFSLDLLFYEDKDSIDTADYTPSNEWVLLAHPAVRNVKFYPCCQEPYPDLTFTIKMKRMGAFYGYILILPCILLSFLTLIVFWLPPESSAKMIMGMNIFLAFFLLLRLLASATPPASSSVPVLGIYFCLNMMLITLSTFISVFIINLYFRADKKNKVPNWLKTIVIDGMARLFCMTGDFPREPKMRKSEEHTMITHISHGRGRKSSKEKRKIKSPILTYNKWEPPPSANSGRESPLSTPKFHHYSFRESPQIDTLESEVREITRGLRNYWLKVCEKEAVAKVNREWRIIALVLDRFFFFIYTAIIITSLVSLLPKTDGII